MSKIASKPINIPQEVDINIDQTRIKIRGPLGEIEYNLPDFIKVIREDNCLKLSLDNKKDKFQKAMHGTAKRLIENMIKGVAQGYQKKLQLVGVGFNAKRENDYLVLNLGFSHPVRFLVPENIDIQVEKNTLIIIKGIDKQLVGQTAAKIRQLKKPEPYKGKGIRYEAEVIRKKLAKKVVTETV